MPEAGFFCELASSRKTELSGIQFLFRLDASFRWHDKQKRFSSAYIQIPH
jgi:hypothetical protein